jgi:hypothetical protein
MPILFAKLLVDAEETFPVPQCGQLCDTESFNLAIFIPLAKESGLPPVITPETPCGQQRNP